MNYRREFSAPVSLRCTEPVTASLPNDLFHSHIIPGLLSDHLHLLLVENEPPSWHAFHALPLVSVEFRNSCQSLYMAIFGIKSSNDSRCAPLFGFYLPGFWLFFSVIYEIVTFAQSLWSLARLPPERIEPPPEPPKLSYMDLMSNKSLIGVYVSIAIARSFLNADVLWPMTRQATLTDLGSINQNEDSSEAYATPVARRFSMRDEKMHRVYMPLMCATKMCDLITPARLTFPVVGHLAKIIPVYSTGKPWYFTRVFIIIMIHLVPVMLKYTQDLETYVFKRHRIQTVCYLRSTCLSPPSLIIKETYVQWTLQTLRLIERSVDLLTQIRTTGRLVNSLSGPLFIPDEVIQVSTSHWSIITPSDFPNRWQKLFQRCIML